MRGRTAWAGAGRWAANAAGVVACGGILLAAAGCGRGRVNPVISSNDASEKIPGIVQAVKHKDLPKARHMVKGLSSDDPAVRMFSIGGLRRLTGETFGYNYYDDEEAREPSVKQWQEWLAAQEPAPKK